MNIAGRRNTSNTSSVGRQEETDDLYAWKKTPVGIPHTLGVTGSVLAVCWVHFTQDNG